MSKLFKKIGLFYWTVRYLKPMQIINRLKRKIFPAKIDLSKPPALSSIDHENLIFIKRSKSILDHNQYHFLNQTKELTFPTAWNNTSYQKLWLYNLHYFEGLLCDETSVEDKERMIQRWIDDNTPGKGNGWEPYPISLRIVNWIKWTWDGNKLSALAVHSLAAQTRFLAKTLEFHLCGNHLFANAKALIFSGLFFEGAEADSWYDKGITILQEQVPEQFLEDGGHFELSPTYHALLTEDLLDILSLLVACGKEFPSMWKQKVYQAMQWIVIMTRPDGLPPLFNDSAYDIAPSLKNLLALNEACGFKVPDPVKEGVYDLTHSGYFRYEAEHYSFFGDAGHIGPDYLPGHGHCDMLSFELFSHGQPLFVNTGTSTYEMCERREIERSTKAHNTVQIGDSEQSEIWGSFRVARRAIIKNRTVRCHDFSGESCQASGIHQRAIKFNTNRIMILDKVSKSKHSGFNTARFHLHPGRSAEIDGNCIKIGGVEMQFKNHMKISVVPYEYAKSFNLKQPSNVIEVQFKDQLRTVILL